MSAAGAGIVVVLFLGFALLAPLALYAWVQRETETEKMDRAAAERSVRKDGSGGAATDSGRSRSDDEWGSAGRDDSGSSDREWGQ